MAACDHACGPLKFLLPNSKPEQSDPYTHIVEVPGEVNIVEVEHSNTVDPKAVFGHGGAHF